MAETRGFGRKTSTGLAGVQATCQDCGWESAAKNALGNAARHHDATGHYVMVEQTTLIAYGERSVPPGQQTLA